MDKSTQAGVSRRQLLQLGGIAAAGIVGATALTGCSPEVLTGNSEETTVAGHTRAGLPSFFEAPEPITNIAQQLDYDVVVVGAGAAGVPAALSAAEAGAKVALIQKQSCAVSQGNTGSGIDLSKSNAADVKNLLSLLIEEGDHRTQRELLELWANNSGEAVSWVIERSAAGGGSIYNQGSVQQAATIAKHGWEMEFVTSFAGPKPLTAGDAMRALCVTAAEAGVDIYYSTPAKQLVTDGGAVTGVIAYNEDGYTQFNAAKGVIMATGDYQSNEEMSLYYLPDLANFTRKQNGKDGDGHCMVVWAGGTMEFANAQTKMLHDFDGGPAAMCDMPFMAVKNSTGERFANEEVEMSLMNNYLTSAADAGHYCQIFDSNYVDYAADWPGSVYDPEALKLYMPEEEMEDRTGVFSDQIRTFKADTLEELAEKLEIADVDAFVAAVARYNELVELGEDEDFGKDAKYLEPIVDAPFYGIHRWIRLSAICSGVKVNGHHQCVTPEGEPIEGLFAIGNCSGSFYGGVDYPMTIPGLSLGRCYTEGYVTGRYVAEL